MRGWQRFLTRLHDQQRYPVRMDDERGGHTGSLSPFICLNAPSYNSIRILEMTQYRNEKVKFALEQAIKAQRRSSGTAVLFL